MQYFAQLVYYASSLAKGYGLPSPCNPWLAKMYNDWLNCEIVVECLQLVLFQAIYR